MVSGGLIQSIEVALHEDQADGEDHEGDQMRPYGLFLAARNGLRPCEMLREHEETDQIEQVEGTKWHQERQQQDGGPNGVKVAIAGDVFQCEVRVDEPGDEGEQTDQDKGVAEELPADVAVKEQERSPCRFLHVAAQEGPEDQAKPDRGHEPPAESLVHNDKIGTLFL